jgi:opacity protein-like surface antigen
MRAWIIAAFVVLVPAASFAQTEKAYVAGAGGVVTTVNGSSGDMLGEVGVKIAPNLFVFGDFGRFRNLAPDSSQASVAAAASDFAATGVFLTGTSVVPAWYSTGGVRYMIPTSTRFSPYAFTGIGLARLSPANRFTYTSGALSGATPSSGDDVTATLVSLGEYTQPPASNAFMFSAGGGVEIPVLQHLSADVGYRYSRVSADTPLNAQSVTFGLGYRF